jgi:hypothetical protein
MTPATRIALKANGASAALDLAEIAEPLREGVIEVGLSRGKQRALWRAEVERA